MEQQDFSVSVKVDASTEALFDAIVNVRGWWSEDVIGESSDPGDEFSYRYRDLHQCRIRVTGSVRGQKVSWLVIDNNFSFVEDRSEWVGNEILFTIEANGTGSLLHFEQRGLTPANECYGVCRDAWTNYISNSLRKLAETGAGTPNPKEGGYNSELAKKWEIEA
ncbi:MAG: SRPBCC domain-containing protein [Chitinophagaceae bacterium]|nr:MAG: SRPBCC domain-containing protein [Chitinophagaceae bacterium]